MSIKRADSSASSFFSEAHGKTWKPLSEGELATPSLTGVFAESSVIRTISSTRLFARKYETVSWTPTDELERLQNPFIYWKEPVAGSNTEAFFVARIQQPAGEQFYAVTMEVYSPENVITHSHDKSTPSKVKRVVKLRGYHGTQVWYQEPKMLQGFQPGMLSDIRDSYPFRRIVSQPSIPAGLEAIGVKSLWPLHAAGVFNSERSSYAYILWEDGDGFPRMWERTQKASIETHGKRYLTEHGTVMEYSLRRGLRGLHWPYEADVRAFEQHQRAILFSGLEGVV